MDDKKVEKTDFTNYQNEVTNKFATKLDKDGSNIGDKNDKNTFGNNVGVGTLDNSTSLVQSKAVKSAIDNINTAIVDQEISYKANNGISKSVKLSDWLPLIFFQVYYFLWKICKDRKSTRLNSSH